MSTGDSPLPGSEGAQRAEGQSVEGERGIASVNRVRSIQSRMSALLAAGLMGVLGLGVLSWYYKTAFTRTANAQEAAQEALSRRAQGEMPLPPLPALKPPPANPAETELLDRLLGPRPDLPPQKNSIGSASIQESPAGTTGQTSRQLRTERELHGEVFARGQNASQAYSPGGVDAALGGDLSELGTGLPNGDRGSGTTGGDFGNRLTPTATPAVRAHLLPTRRLLLGKGAFLDCTLETAIDSSLPGMTTCVTATDTYGVDGTVVLLERGTKLIGETRGEVRQGSRRLFILWSEARTPTGVVIPLASPGTDELGRSGVSGQIDRHFWSRFGAAMLISVIDGAVQASSRSGSGSGTVVLNPSGTRDLMTEVLRDTIGIAPTLSKPQGDRIQVVVARDLDFRNVYRLTHVVASHE